MHQLSRLWKLFPVAALLLVGLGATANAQDAAAAAETVAEAVTEAAAEAPAFDSLETFAESPGYAVFTINNVWMMIATALVFLMHLGFATVESGLTQAKNTVNILFKNTLIPCIGLLSYAAIGFNLMYPGDGWTVSNVIGAFSPGVSVSDPVAGLTSNYNAGYTYWTDFLFQGMFAATAATIVSGAVAERVKLGAFLVFSVIYVSLVYPIVGSWDWGYGWLEDLSTPFYDFAGSTLVHSVGGWAALAGAIVLGPRLGKYLTGGKIKPIPAHSFPLATIGVFLLWLGWFGFNGGSVLSANPALVSLTLMTTSMAAAAGGLAATLTSWFVLKKPDLSMALNGILAGLVAITAGADQMDALSSSIIGVIGGILVVFSVIFFDKIKIDDPVGAISVHLVCGIFGTLAVGLFGAKAGGAQLVTQLIGVGAVGALCFPAAFLIFYLLKVTVGLRVSEEEEVGGLDIGEHGQEAYADFQPRSR